MVVANALQLEAAGRATPVFLYFALITTSCQVWSYWSYPGIPDLSN